MSRGTIKRVRRLEARKPARQVRGFTSMEQDDSAFEAWKQALIASGEAHEDDRFVQIKFVNPSRMEESVR
jgi:hypothetical protein